VIEGVYVPLLTAFTEEGDVDVAACVAHAEWAVDRGVNGLVPFGTSGEGPSLSFDERVRVLDALTAALPDTPIVATVTDPSLDGALRLIEACNERPLQAVMVLPPFYFHPVPDESLSRFFEPIVARSEHPVLLYHIPELAPAIPLTLVERLPIWGMKDSGGDLAYTRAVIDSGKPVMVGAEHTIVDAVLAGAAGTIAGTANVLPEHLSAAVTRAQAGDEVGARQAIRQLLDFRDELLSRLAPLEWVSALKLLATARHGTPLGGGRPPVPTVATETVAQVVPLMRDALDRLVALA
jgi:4-hydroxy-tetrahydrodipicolinate synthase